jgi:hypothetical protein
MWQVKAALCDIAVGIVCECECERELYILGKGGVRKAHEYVLCGVEHETLQCNASEHCTNKVRKWAALLGIAATDLQQTAVTVAPYSCLIRS